MDRLSIVLTLAVGALITGGFIVIVLALGFYNGWAILGAGILGLCLSWPGAYMVSRRIKRRDPEWDETKIDEAGNLPRPDDREV